jgi:branched-chain amino acid transport system ATP-binding protein
MKPTSTSNENMNISFKMATNTFSLSSGESVRAHTSGAARDSRSNSSANDSKTSGIATRAVLKASDVGIKFGGLKAVDGFNLDLFQGELVGLIGPNGAGKTTVFNILTGVYQPTEGSVSVEGVITKGLKPYEISRLGLARTFQNIRLFKELSVLDNVLISMQRFAEHSVLDSLLANQKHFRSEADSRNRALELLKIFNLDRLANSLASDLPYGDQRKLEIIRALACRPKVILLDEPAAGMNTAEKKELMHTIDQIRKDFELTVLLIEHDMKLVMGICERILVLDHGVIIASGT